MYIEREIEWVEQGLSDSRHTKVAQHLRHLIQGKNIFRRISVVHFGFVFHRLLIEQCKNCFLFMTTENQNKSPVLLLLKSRTYSSRRKNFEKGTHPVDNFWYCSVHGCAVLDLFLWPGAYIQQSLFPNVYLRRPIKAAYSFHCNEWNKY